MRRATALSVAILLAATSAPRAQQEERAVLGLDGKPDTLPDAAFVETVRKECSQCHLAPQPQYVPRSAWRTRIQEMALHSMAGTGLAPGEATTLWQLELAPFIRYYEARAPDTLPLPEPWPDGDGGLRFERRSFSPREASGPPVVANTRLFDLDGDGRLELVVCDMRRGVVMLGKPAAPPERAAGEPAAGSAGELEVIATLANPAHSEMVDLDGDGRRDLLVADLGAFLPDDHTRGSLVWLRQTEPLRFETIPLVRGIPRTADVQAADFDGDGDLDLVAAVFGFHTLGGVFVYENRTSDWQEPRFEAHVVDARPGAIHVPVVDLDRDGRPDFVALVSQQYEHVVAFINRGSGIGFRPETIFRAVTPVWGSSGIQLVDLDGDRDLDLLMSNGDSLDDFTIRPFHGVRWFENRGGYPWQQHDLASMPGAHRAQAADLDGDGDQDVVAAAFLPNAEHPAAQRLGSKDELSALTSLGWLEQTTPGRFVAHPLERGRFTHATLDLGDVDGDGRVDVVAGTFAGSGFVAREVASDAGPAVELWLNRGRASLNPAAAAPAAGPPERP